jgi:hypothetical protein
METEVRRHLQRAGHRVGDAGLVTALADAAAAAGLPARDLADRYDAYLLNRCVCGPRFADDLARVRGRWLSSPSAFEQRRGL